MKYIQALITMVVGVAVLAFDGAAVAQTVKPCLVTVVKKKVKKSSKKIKKKR